MTIYYIDIRAFGKGYEEFYEQTDGMGVRFVKGKVAKISENDDGDLMVSYEDIDATAPCARPSTTWSSCRSGSPPRPAAFGFSTAPSSRRTSNLFVARARRAPRTRPHHPSRRVRRRHRDGAADIPDTILHAGAAASQVAAYLAHMKRKP